LKHPVEAVRSLLPNWAAGTFAFLVLCVAAWIATYSVPADARPAPGTAGALRHALHHGLGLSRARAARSLVRVDGRGLELGDVIVAGHAGSTYGYFSHVSLITGPDQTLGQHPAYGIDLMPLATLVGYDDVRVLRAELSAAQRREVAAFVRGLDGAPFNVLALKEDAYWWNCSKVVWAAFRRVGIDLAPERDLVVPDDIAASPRLRVVRAFRGR
jgi:hypothetical protein